MSGERAPRSLILLAAGALSLLVGGSLAHAQDAGAANEPPPQAARQPDTQPTTQPATAPAPCNELELGRDEDVGLLELEMPVVVTATHRPQRIATVPYAISVITAQDIRRSGASSVPDALRLSSGVDVADLSFATVAASPRGLHGFLSRDVLVLVDGRQIFDSLFGGKLWGAWPFQLEDVQRIEVIRGPAGVTWGGNAVNGVINIITKDPVDQLGLTFTGLGGSRGWHKEHLGYAFADEKLRLRVSGEYEASDGFKRGGSILAKLEDDAKTGRVSLHAIYEPTLKDRLIFSAGNALADGGYPPTPLAGIGRKHNPGTRASFLLGRWTHTVACDNLFELTGYVNECRGSPGLAAVDYNYQQLAFQCRHTFRPADAHILTWGIDNRVYLVDPGNSHPSMLAEDFVASTSIGLYLQDEWRFAPRLNLNLGGRIDYESYGGFQPSARAALSFEINDNSLLYGAVSRAFEMPPAAERFLRISMLNDLAYTTADRDVTPDILLAYEVGYRGELFDRVKTNLNLFWHEYEDLTILRMLPGPPGLLRYEFDNGYSASLYGAELDLRYAATDNLTLLGNYTYQIWNNKGPASMTEADSLVSPKHKFMLGARYSPTRDFHLAAHLYYVDTVTSRNPGNPFMPRRVDPYFRLDLRAEHEFWNDRASVAVGVRNLLDPHHYEGGTLFLNDAEVPRMVYAELRLAVK